jgi:hypothetical protein
MLWRHQAGTLGHLFAREAHEHASGMELRTGKSNHRHEKIARALAIAHNVNNFHQAAGALTTCLAPWLSALP